ncbi:MAG TPA: hypothetical protein VJP86_05340 [Vicinamibacterales bacterium]|jgi:hypothetical protein|nr:hypothetical protein [Vicinamibacterales bacterium]
MSWLRIGLAITCLARALPVAAQQTTPVEPALRRWIEIQNLTLSDRYRYIENNRDVVTSNHLQYKDTFRGRFNFDAEHRFTLNAGIFSGNNFTGSWNNTGIGTGDGDIKDHYLKQLFGSAIPITGLEVQYGGLYFSRGESTEVTTYDEDGYLVGERVTVRRPDKLWLDEVTVTRAMVGPTQTPFVGSRWDGLTDPNYTQVLTAKKFSNAVSGSLDYSTQSDADTIRAAVSIRLAPSRPISLIRYEQYYRTTPNEAAGFALWLERPITSYLRAQGGYATIDENYGGLNADRFQRGRRVFAIANLRLVGPLSASFFVTQAFHADYSISNSTRFDAVLTYDVLSSLRKTGVF